MSSIGREFVRAAREAPRMFFAPLLGAIEAIKREVQEDEQEPRTVKAHVKIYKRKRKLVRRVELKKQAKRTTC